VVRSPVRLEA